MEKLSSFGLVSILLILAFSLLGAGENQIERPPQPFFQDFFSGKVTVQGSAPPVGTLLIACIDDCDTVFESEPYGLKSDGVFDQKPGNPHSAEWCIGKGMINIKVIFSLPQAKHFMPSVQKTEKLFFPAPHPQ